jgi:hypothetical protein
MDATVSSLARRLKGYPEHYSIEELESIIQAAEEALVRKTFNDFPTGRYETARKVIVHVKNDSEDNKDFRVEFESRDEKLAFIGDALQAAARKNLEQKQAAINIREPAPRRAPARLGDQPLNLDGAPDLASVQRILSDAGPKVE